MKEFVARSLKHGLYRLHWNDGGSSLASVGSDVNGWRWFSATNWTSGPSRDWSVVKAAELLMSSDQRESVQLMAIHTTEDPSILPPMPPEPDIKKTGAALIAIGEALDGLDREAKIRVVSAVVVLCGIREQIIVRLRSER